VPESDLKDMIARLGIEQVQCNGVLARCFAGRDRGDGTAQPTGGTPALAGNEFWAAHDQRLPMSQEDDFAAARMPAM